VQGDPAENENGVVRVTIARWLTPNERQIHEVGLTPDVVVEITEEDIAAERDPQLEKAIELLTSGGDTVKHRNGRAAPAVPLQNRLERTMNISWKRVLYFLLVVVVATGSGMVGVVAGGLAVFSAVRSNLPAPAVVENQPVTVAPVVIEQTDCPAGSVDRSGNSHYADRRARRSGRRNRVGCRPFWAAGQRQRGDYLRSRLYSDQ
jgi:hypothetical protein